MRVLLCITNVNGFHEVPYSFGMNSVASSVVAAGHDVKICSVCSQDGMDKFIDDVCLFKPDIVGFSTVSSQFYAVCELSKKVKAVYPDKLVVCGGVHPTLHPQDLLIAPSIDYFFVGESENAFVEFVDAVRVDGDVTKINNIAYRDGDGFTVNPLNPLLDSEGLGALPAPLKGDLFQEYIDATGYAPFFFSRGCPFHCTYCSNHALAKVYDMKVNRPRFRPYETCIEEIEAAMSTCKFSKVYILDDTFGLDAEWRKGFLSEYKKRIGLPFICLLRANVVDENLIKQLKDCGCQLISFGVESGNDHIRNTVMRRSLGRDQMITAFRLCRKYGIKTTALNIIGVPGESEEMIWETVKLNRILKADNSGVNIFILIRVPY